MMRSFSQQRVNAVRENVKVLGLIAAVLVLSVVLGLRPSPIMLGMTVGVAVGLTVLAKPKLGLYTLIFSALYLAIPIGTGTDVQLNVTTLLLSVVIVLWVARMLTTRKPLLQPTGVNRPLLLFLFFGFVSLIAGNALWDPGVPRPNNLILVQLAQWGLWALSAGALLLVANTVNDVRQLKRLSFTFLALGFPLVLMRTLLGEGWWTTGGQISTEAIYQATFWVCIASLAGGQILFNSSLPATLRSLCVGILVAVMLYSVQVLEEKVSLWVGVAAVVGLLVFLKLGRHRWLFATGCIIAALFLYPTIYRLAGGDEKWQVSGGSRLALSTRVIEMTSRDPILGLGPASYRQYGFTQPLMYRYTLWLEPQISAHNNYVDIYGQQGLIGLGLFLWFAVEYARLGWRLRKVYRTGFAAGYVNGMLAALGAMLLIMLFLDWFLPFVYDLGFRGFQASMLMWLFMGGLVSLEFAEKRASGKTTTNTN